MPIYEYECPSCSCRFEQKRSFSDESPAVCPQCRCDARRIFSPVPIIFKGAGFYVTDYKGNRGHSAATGGGDQTESGDIAKAKAGSTETAKGSTTE